MKRSPNTIKLTKDYIERYVSQELIVSKYLDIPMEIVEDCIERGTMIQSVFRDDDHDASMGIRYNQKGRLKVRDFGGFGFFEDVYGVVAYVLSNMYGRQIDTSNKQDFYFILQHIAKTFSKLIDGKETDPNIDDAIKASLISGRKKRQIIEIATRNWNQDDKDIWSKWNVNLGFLNTNFVFPVDQYYVNRKVDTKPKYRYNRKDPCYAYLLGQDRTGIYLFKLYFPLRDRHKQTKFLTNCNVLEGLLNLERFDYDFIIITKSTKDRLSIGSHLSHNPLYRGERKLNIGIINLPSENYQMKQKEYNWLVKKLKPDGEIFSLLDFDRTGRQGAKYLEETYDIPYLFITRGEFGLENLHQKDFADLHDSYTNEEINQFIKDTLKYVEIRRQSMDDTDADFQGLADDHAIPF